MHTLNMTVMKNVLLKLLELQPLNIESNLYK